MDILVLLKIIIRRWLVVLPVMAIVMATGYNTIKSIKPEFEASADVLLLTPSSVKDPTTGNVIQTNPLLDIRGGLATTGVILQTIVTDTSHHDALIKQNLSADYNVSVNGGAPIINVSAKAKQPQVADGTVAAVVNQISSELKTNQDALAVANDSRVSARVLTVSKAYELVGQKTRVAAAVGVVGFAAVIGAALLAESLAASRKRRRNVHADAELAALLTYPEPLRAGPSYDAESAESADPEIDNGSGDGNGDGGAVATGEAVLTTERSVEPPPPRWKSVSRKGRPFRQHVPAPGQPPTREL